MKKLTGIELIAKERNEQIVKHGYTTEHDELVNGNKQLVNAATALLARSVLRPTGWDEVIWNKMISKPYQERLIIAGALLAAEIDRIQCAD